MDAFLQWLSANPTIADTLLFALSGLVLALALMYVVAFLQGREVSFWPPHIGKMPESGKPSEKESGSVRTTKAKPSPAQQPLSFFVTAQELEAVDPIVGLINRSEDLLFGGVALGYSAQRHKPQLLKQLEKGARLRFLVLDPDSPGIDPMAKMYEVSAEQIREHIRDTLRDLETLRNRAKSIKSGSVEVRLLACEPAFSFAISNPKSLDGYFSAGLRVYRHRSATRPYFVLKQTDNWFHFFIDSCENLWNDSQPWPRNAETLKSVSARAGVVAYRSTKRSGVEVLLITARTNPQRWIFPVGEVDAGETLQQTAIRECAEESGYTVEIGAKLGTIEFDEGESINQMTFFIARVTGETSRYETDRQRKWVLLSELINNVAEDFLPIARAATIQLAS